MIVVRVTEGIFDRGLRVRPAKGGVVEGDGPAVYLHLVAFSGRDQHLEYIHVLELGAPPGFEDGIPVEVHPGLEVDDTLLRKI